jgi:hypothetical protein
LTALLACLTVAGCTKDEKPALSAAARQTNAPETPSQAVTAIPRDVKKEPSSVVKADVDCDGREDTALLEYVDGHVRVSVTLAAADTSRFLEFGLGDSGAQDSLCGSEATLEIEDMDYDLTEAFGENPEGFQQSKTCKGLRLMGGECDSMHIFWNHATQNIDWWRL